MAKRLTGQVTVYTNGAQALTEEISTALKESVSGIRIDGRKIAKLVKGTKAVEVDVIFDDGGIVTEGFLVRLEIASIALSAILSGATTMSVDENNRLIQATGP